VLDLAAPTVLLQWAVGGLFFLWITTRRREVGLGYGWLQRLTFIALAGLSAWIGFASSPVPVREWSTIVMIAACSIALGVSVARRKVGVAGQRTTTERRTARVAAMTGIDRDVPRFDADGAEFPPVLDLFPPLIGVVGLVAAAIDAGDPPALSIARTLVGAAFLGAVTDAMLLGHWYLVQPGLSREPLNELVRWVGWLWPLELLVLMWPIGMWSVLDGSIDDGYNGLLGWFWVACAAATIGLVAVTTAALRERQYSAVMAATGLLYLAILTAFGMDLVARVLLDT
jgi:hypothetical protein